MPSRIRHAGRASLLRAVASCAAISILAAAPAAAAAIQIVVTTTIVASPEDVRVAIEMRNRGDEPALAITPIVTFRGEDTVADTTATLNPSESHIESVTIPVSTDTASGELHGSWPLVVRVGYTDHDHHAFEALHVTAVRFGPAAQSGGLTLELTGARLEKSGQLVAKLAAGTTNKVRLTFASAEGLAVTPAEQVIPLTAGESRSLAAAIVVRGATASSRLPIFAIAESETADGHDTVVAPALIEIEAAAGAPVSSSKRWIVPFVAAIVLLLAAIAVMAARGARGDRGLTSS